MQDRSLSYFNIVKSPWRVTLLEAVKTVQSNVFCVSPFFTNDVILNLEEIFLSQGHEANSLTMHVITRIRRDDFLSKASHLEAFERLLSWPLRFPMWNVELRAKDEIHAKVWIIDTKSAFVGSGNATYSGLGPNIEYGIAITSSDFIQRMQSDWLPIWNQSQLITTLDLQNMRTLLEMEKTTPQIEELEKILKQLRQEVAQKSNLPIRLGTARKSSPMFSHTQLEIPHEEVSDISSTHQEALATQLTLDSLLEDNKQVPELQITIAKAPERLIPKNTFQVKTHELLQALHWMSPPLETQELLYTPPVGYTHNEFIWLPDQGLFYCYADRQLRRSQAIIRVLGDSDKTNWNIKLEARILKELQSQLQTIILQDLNSSIWLSLDDIHQQLILSEPQENEKKLAIYDVDITHESSKWKDGQQSSYRITARHTALLNAVIRLKNLITEESTLTATLSDLPLSTINYGLRFTLYMGEKTTQLKEPVLKIRREEVVSEKVIETIVEGNGKKYPYSQGPIARNISFNDLIIALHGTPEQLCHWRILLDYDRLSEFDGVKNRPIVGLQPETPPHYIENTPDLLKEWWHMLYPYWE